MFFRLNQIFLNQISLANIFVRRFVAGRKHQRLLVMLEGAGVIAGVAIGVTQIVVNIGIIFIDFQGFF